MDFPQVFYLLVDDIAVSIYDWLDTLSNIPVEERPSMVFFVVGISRHIIVLWEIERLYRAYYNLYHWDGNVFALNIDMVEVVLPPTFLTKY